MKDIIIWNNTLLDILISFAIIIGGFLVAKLIYFQSVWKTCRKNGFHA